MSVAFVFPNEASGQTRTEIEMARSLMDEGDAQLERGDAKGALRSYRAAHTIMNVPTTGIEVARMEAKLRHLVEARKVALEVARMPVKPREPKPFTEARSDAQLLADALETRIPRLTIEMKGALSAATVELKIDGRILPSEEIRDPIPVDPGKHEVVLVPSGGEPESRTVTVSENEKRTLTFGDGSASSDTAKPVRRTSPLVFVGFGLGGVGLIAGAITGGLSLSGASEVEKICPKGTCPSQTDINQAKPIHDRAYTLANVSNVAFALGVVGVGLGVTGLLLGPAADKKPESETAFRVFVGPNGALVRGSF
ncbi:MAG TPA: hypothetical protein PK156_43135 [Polyangium sp.]|nr:hypothetical protein [Polyangium sp.]